jgi:hypothetical protein
MIHKTQCYVKFKNEITKVKINLRNFNRMNKLFILTFRKRCEMPFTRLSLAPRRKEQRERERERAIEKKINGETDK